MKLKIGTFNLNNLFSRFNFKADISSIKKEPAEDSIVYSEKDSSIFKIRKFHGRLVRPKDLFETMAIAQRLREMDLDIVAVQEVEDIDILKQFNNEHLDGLNYNFVTLIEGNDPRLIDVGLLSRYPIGHVTSWQHARYDGETRPIFSRDLIQADVLNSKGNKKMFTIFNTHLKSSFLPFNTKDFDAELQKSGERRKKQAEMVAKVRERQTRPNSNYLLLGDMNDTPDSGFLEPFQNSPGLINTLQSVTEVGVMNNTKYGPPNNLWTHRYNTAAGVYQYHLYDQIWISPALADNLTGSFIKRRKNVGGDGSDHDPVWVELDIKN
jgi:endonuclease/exonuclease/phosphatase family metal-dependent hydrolase